MRLSDERIKSLQALMRKKHGLELTDEQAQEAGFAIMRFVVAKFHREQELTSNEDSSYGKPSDTKVK